MIATCLAFGFLMGVCVWLLFSHACGLDWLAAEVGRDAR